MVGPELYLFPCLSPSGFCFRIAEIDVAHYELSVIETTGHETRFQTRITERQLEILLSGQSTGVEDGKSIYCFGSEMILMSSEDIRLAKFSSSFFRSALAHLMRAKPSSPLPQNSGCQG